MMKSLSIRKRQIALFCCALFLFELLYPAASFALTSGPGQPEVQSFKQAGTTEMVDLFSGDFSYNIPLFELPGPNGGYPFNLSYQAGIGMDQEASWVGLGWSLNPGAITRQMRGLPDEFKGDLVTTRMSIKPSVTVGLGSGAGMELFGADGLLSLSGGFSVSHNNYKGIGYSIDGSVGFAKAAGDGATAGIGLNVSLDSKEGVSMQPSLSLAGEIGAVGLSAGYNSKSGLHTISFDQSVNFAVNGKGAKNSLGKREDKSVSTTMAGTANLSLAHPGYTPQIGMPMKNLNLAAEFRPGASWWGVFGNIYVRGFYNEQRLDKDKRNVTAEAYGYMHYQDALDDKALLDFNREKDGIVMKESPNLAIPSLTYDIYSVTAQGISAMYRPMRNDYGIIHDQHTESVSNGGSVGVDLGPAATHIGVNLSINHAKSTSGPWRDDNDLNDKTIFQSSTANDLYEPWYFKVHGSPNAESETTVAKIGGDNPVRVKLNRKDNRSVNATGIMENKALDWTGSAPESAVENQERKTRNQVIQQFTNEQLWNQADADPEKKDVMQEFKVRYLDYEGEETLLDRSGRPHHLGVVAVTTADGLRYNYALPAYNLKHEEVTFSAQQPNGQLSKVMVVNTGDAGDPKYDYGDTDEFLKSVEIPAYAHAHMLTSILGTDYVDLTGDGVTADDLGYWVKFTYQKVTPDGDPYKWRDPFSKAHYQAGWKTDPRDDKGSFQYGEKELWYLARAETKTHIATFKTSARTDCMGVLHKLQDAEETGKAVHQLDEINLFVRTPSPPSGAPTPPVPRPLKTVKFRYDNSLCNALYTPLGSGKLTLKEVWFEYGGSERGLNPYKFTYEGLNPDYDNLAFDRWGNYRPYPAGEFDYNRDFPYVNQGETPTARAARDENAGAWSLTKIDLPSGGQIRVDYESDDYGYVQHKPAMQMMEIIDPEDFTSQNFILDDDLVRIRFKLETPITGTMSDADQEKEVLKYLDEEQMQLYFRILVNLRSQGEGFYEYVCGYADIDEQSPMRLEKESAGGDYTHGYFHLKKEEGNNGKKYHPFSMRTWQHLRANQPDLANSGRKLKQTDSQGERVDQIKSLGSIGTQVRQMFETFYGFCDDKHWGREVAVGKSWVRLRSPDRVKYGGGLRVRQITMNDQWQSAESIYGQVYEYMIEENGQEISSGVAAFEPFVGGDENPLRHAKKFVQSVPMRADNVLFFEHPVNESYFPGAHVGYRKVTVWSLASAALKGDIPLKNTSLTGNVPAFPTVSNATYGTSGKTEHEFFTAKDFPVIVGETDKESMSQRLVVPVPFLGNITVSKLTASQGYSVITNDMHGKPRKVSNYRQDKNGKAEEQAISWVEYNYLSQEQAYDNTMVDVLVNTLEDNGDNTLSIDAADPDAAKFTLGQEIEFFTDMREAEDNTWSGGARYNTDIVYIPIVFVVVPVPVPTVWPSVSKSQNRLRTTVTNKVIFKSGILHSTKAYDGGSKIETRNEKWDKLTGVSVLTVTNNNFDAPLFNYSILAHSQYEGMGGAYQNIGLTFDISTVSAHAYKKGYYEFYTTLPEDILYPGDEVILYEQTPDNIKPVARAVYTGNSDGDALLYSATPLTLPAYRCMIVRSGYRNQLSAQAGTITALQDPSRKGAPVTYNKTITIAK